MPTINDVAMASGVSIGTVSTVLNNAPRPVRPETRQRVLAAAKRLNYHPNAMASGLVRRRMDTIGVLSGVFAAVDVVSDNYASGVLQGILSVAQESDFHVTLFTKFWEDSAHSAAAYRDKRTDGILVIAPDVDSDMIQVLSSFGLTLVTISALPVDGIASVDVDNSLGAAMAAEYLLDLGHTRIAHIAGNAAQLSARERMDAFAAKMNERGIKLDDHYLVSAKYSGETVDEAVRQLMSLPKPPTAIFGGNDAIARRIVGAVEQMGYRVPDDLSVIGFDDSPAAKAREPHLSTIHQPLAEVGECAAKLLIELINGKTRPAKRHLFKPTLVVRATTSAPRKQSC
jgi:LacI family transcriptional regulator